MELQKHSDSNIGLCCRINQAVCSEWYVPMFLGGFVLREGSANSFYKAPSFKGKSGFKKNMESSESVQQSR